MPAPNALDLAIDWVSRNSLKAAAGNARKHSKRQIELLAQSIGAFGFIVPVLADQDGHVLAGHARLLASQKLGQDRVPIIRIEHLSPAQAKAFSLADNRLCEIAAWDDRLLAEALKELSAIDIDFNIEATGFTIGEIDLVIADPKEHCAEEDTVEYRVPDSTTPPVTVAGDVWQCGRHLIRCGNALESQDYDAVMQADKAAMVFADPPYNVKIDGHASGLGQVHHREFAMASGEMSPGEYTAFLRCVFSMLARYSVDGSIHFICNDWRHAGEVLASSAKQYTELKNLCVWAKPNAGMGSFYRSQHELVFVFKNGKDKHRNNIQLGRNGRNRTNVWKYPAANHFGRSGDEGNILHAHPTPKPVKMVADAILDCTAPGDIVLDPFLGSGSTLIAAERVARACRGVEIDPGYIDVAISRWQNYTGADAVHVESNMSFNDRSDRISDG